MLHQIKSNPRVETWKPMSYVPHPPYDLFCFVFIPDFNPFRPSYNKLYFPAKRKRKRMALVWTSGGFAGLRWHRPVPKGFLRCPFWDSRTEVRLASS